MPGPSAAASNKPGAVADVDEEAEHAPGDDTHHAAGERFDGRRIEGVGVGSSVVVPVMVRPLEMIGILVMRR